MSSPEFGDDRHQLLLPFRQPKGDEGTLARKMANYSDRFLQRTCRATVQSVEISSVLLERLILLVSRHCYLILFLGTRGAMSLVRW